MIKEMQYHNDKQTDENVKNKKGYIIFVDNELKIKDLLCYNSNNKVSGSYNEYLRNGNNVQDTYFNNLND
jgi:hypothetical protein